MPSSMDEGAKSNQCNGWIGAIEAVLQKESAEGQRQSQAPDEGWGGKTEGSTSAELAV